MAVPARYRLLETGDKRLMETGSPDDRLLETAYEPYKDAIVFPFRANWGDEPDEALQRSMTTLDNVTGLHTVRSHTTTPIASFEMTVTLVGRDEIIAFKQYVKDLKGRALPTWVPTWLPDMKPTTDFSGTSMVIESIGYEDDLYPHNARKHLAIIDHTGEVFVRGVSGASDNGTTETITLDATMGQTIYANACLVSFLMYARIDSDALRIDWNSRELAEARIGFVELPREAPAP